MSSMLEKFVEEIKRVCGDNLKSVILYGSKASGESTKKFSDYNLLLVLNKISFQDLKSITFIADKWIKQKNPPPLIFSAERLNKSTDVFPIEFLDMKEHHKVLYGDDPFTDMQINLRHLRHECESELKGKLLKLRQGYMNTGGKTSGVRELLISSVSTFLIVSRHILYLLGRTPPAKRLDALNMLSEHIKINTEPFISILKMKNEEKETSKLDPVVIFEQYIEEIEKIVDFVDDM